MHVSSCGEGTEKEWLQAEIEIDCRCVFPANTEVNGEACAEKCPTE